MRESAIDKTFRISLIIKGLDGLLEIIGGLLVLLIPPATISGFVAFLTQHELTEDPKDFIANHLLTFGHHLLASSILFGFLYLITHGIVKIVLVVAVLKNKLWAYPWMIAFLLTFIGYQLYRLSYKFSVGLLLLIVFDLFIAVLTWIEYKKHKVRSWA